MSTVVKDLGAVSAYAYAVEKGYTGTEAEFAELMADYAEVGQRAEDAADSALESKTAAQTAATAATNKATEATTAATTATNKASEAQTSAQTASTKASEASQSASQALGYKNDAESAKTASQTAQGLAESARDSAISAKNDAESARDDAESARDAVQSSAAQITTNAEDITQLKEELSNINDAVYVSETVWTSVPLTLETGKYWSLSGTDSQYANARRSTDVIQVTAGEKIKISTRISINIAGVIYFNGLPFSKTNFVGYDLYDIPEGVTTRTYSDEEVTVPEGASYVVVQGRSGTGVVFDLKKQNEEYTPKTDILGEEVDAYISSNDFEVKNLERRATSAENRNPFAWSAFDKSYFVFIHDDTNEYLETYAEVFHTKGVPMGAATIPTNITETHLATLRQMVADGGEVLGHYNASPTESSSDATWMSCTGDVKKALEAYGFEVHGLIKANNTASSTDKGQKYCQRYYDYADNHLGKTEQFNLPRTLMLNYESLSAFKARIDTLENVNGIHAFGFHGGRQDEAWITAEAFSEIIDYIQAKTNCEITTYYNLWQTFGSSVLAERIKALES